MTARPDFRLVAPSMSGGQIAGGERPPHYGPTALYRFYCAHGTLLYIGVTGRLADRFNQHRRSAGWWPQVRYLGAVWLPSMYDALDAERAAIAAERPAWNIRSASRVA